LITKDADNHQSQSDEAANLIQSEVEDNLELTKPQIIKSNKK